MISASKVSKVLLHQFLYDTESSDENLRQLLEQNPPLEEFHLVVIPMHQALFKMLAAMSQQVSGDVEQIEEIQELAPGISVASIRQVSGARASWVFEMPPSVLESIALRASSAQVAFDVFVVLQVALHHPEFLTEESYWMLKVIVEEEGKRGNKDKPLLERICQALEFCLNGGLDRGFIMKQRERWDAT